MQEMALDLGLRSPNGFLSSLSDEDFELIRPYLRTVDLVQDSVLAEVGEKLSRIYFPHRGVISLVVNLARGERVQVAMIGREHRKRRPQGKRRARQQRRRRALPRPS